MISIFISILQRLVHKIATAAKQHLTGVWSFWTTRRESKTTDVHCLFCVPQNTMWWTTAEKTVRNSVIYVC